MEDFGPVNPWAGSDTLSQECLWPRICLGNLLTINYKQSELLTNTRINTKQKKQNTLEQSLLQPKNYLHIF